MTDPSSEEDGMLREWAPLTGLLQQIPLKAQRGLFTHDLNLTCIDSLPEFIAVGTNLGLVYWYNRKKGDLQRLRCENTASAITCVKVISTVDYMVAAGNDQGIVTVFQIPRIPPDSLPESMKPKKNKQVERYTISGLHSAPVTAIEWSMNGMKLFSGDKNGLVVLTEIDFYMHLSKSVELLNEKYEIVQLSYSQQLLLVSTLYRSIVCCYREDRWKVSQVGQKERKTLGRLGATFCLGSGRPQELVVYASRPGLRVWLADKNGVVQQTLIYKDALMNEYTNTPLINPAPAHVRQSRGDHHFGPLLVFRENLLVTYSSDIVYVLNPASITVIATVADLRKVQDVSVNKDEIFILEGERSLIRVAYTPENTTIFMPAMEHDYANITDALVNIMCSPLIQSILTNKSIPKEEIWDQVTNKMEEYGFLMGDNGAERCRQKWNSIIHNYHHYTRTRLFDSKSERPSYYSKLEEMFAEQKQIFSAMESSITDLQEGIRGCKRKLDDCVENPASFQEPIEPIGDLSYSEILSSESSEGGGDELFEVHKSDVNIESASDNSNSNFEMNHSLKTEEIIVVFPDYLTVHNQDNNSEAPSDQVVTVYRQDVTLHNQDNFPKFVAHSHSTQSVVKCTEIPKSPCVPQKQETNVNRSLLRYLLPKPTSESVRTPVIITPKLNKPARPIPTTEEAIMSLIMRLEQEDRRKERRSTRRHEARLQRLEALLAEKSKKEKEMFDAALALADAIKESCSDDDE